MNDTLKNKFRKTVAHTLRSLRCAFHDCLSSVRAEYVQEVKASTGDDSNVEAARYEFEVFAKEVEAEIKKFSFTKQETVVEASVRQDVISLLRVAIEAAQKGCEEEAKMLFIKAAFNTNDLLLDNMPNKPLLHNQCPTCNSALPSIANYCPICGRRLDNMLPANQPTLPTTPNVQPIQVPKLETVVLKTVAKLIKKGKKDLAMKLLDNVEVTASDHTSDMLDSLVKKYNGKKIPAKYSWSWNWKVPMTVGLSKALESKGFKETKLGSNQWLSKDKQWGLEYDPKTESLSLGPTE